MLAVQMSLLEGHPVSPSQSQAKGRDFLEQVDSSVSISDCFRKCVRAGLSGRMSQDVYQVAGGKTSSSFSNNGLTSGIMSHGEFWTLNTSEWPRDAAVCLLSDILETGSVPQRYFLSQAACQGILRRAEKRGKKLPKLLERCLRTKAASIGQPGTATS